MTHKPEPQNFEPLKKLLEMKRCEHPPTGYFVGFSAKILQRLQAAEPEPEVTGWRRLFGSGDMKPALVCTWGVVLCASLVVGIMVSAKIPPGPETPLGAPRWEQAGALGELSPLGWPVAATSGQGAAVSYSSTDPVFSPTLQPAGLRIE